MEFDAELQVNQTYDHVRECSRAQPCPRRWHVRVKKVRVLYMSEAPKARARGFTLGSLSNYMAQFISQHHQPSRDYITSLFEY